MEGIYRCSWLILGVNLEDLYLLQVYLFFFAFSFEPESFSRFYHIVPMSTIDEKPPAEHRIEDIAGKSPEHDDEFTAEEKKRIIRRIDLRLVTMTGLAYCISLMDRTNLSMAAIAGYDLVRQYLNE